MALSQIKLEAHGDVGSGRGILLRKIQDFLSEQGYEVSEVNELGKVYYLYTTLKEKKPERLVPRTDTTTFPPTSDAYKYKPGERQAKVADIPAIADPNQAMIKDVAVDKECRFAVIKVLELVDLMQSRVLGPRHEARIMVQDLINSFRG